MRRALLTETTGLHVVHPRTQKNGGCSRNQRDDEQDAADPDIFLCTRDTGDGDGCEDERPDDELGVSDGVFHWCSLVGGGDEEEGDAGEEHGGSEEDGQLAERLELCLGAVYFYLQEVDFPVERDLLAVKLVGVDEELGDGLLVLLAGVVEDGDVFLVLLAGLLEDRERGFNLCYLAFVLDDAPHGVGDVCQGVLVGSVELGVPAVDPVAEVACPLLQGCDVVVDAGDVVDDALVVVDDGLDRSVAVAAACRAVTLSLGGCGCHGVSFLVGVWSVVRIVGMDFSTLFSGGSAFAAIVSAFFAAVSWYQSIGSKKAKAKAEEAHRAALEMRDAAVRSAKAAEERAQQAEEALKQVEQLAAESQKQSKSQADIASHTWRPTFELTWTRGDTFLLRNVTGESVEVVEVANLDDFVRCPQIQQVFSPGEALRVLMLGVFRKPLPSNLKLRIRIDGVDEVISVPIRR